MEMVCVNCKIKIDFDTMHWLKRLGEFYCGLDCRVELMIRRSS